MKKIFLKISFVYGLSYLGIASLFFLILIKRHFFTEGFEISFLSLFFISVLFIQAALLEFYTVIALSATNILEEQLSILKNSSRMLVGIAIILFAIALLSFFFIVKKQIEIAKIVSFLGSLVVTLVVLKKIMIG